MSSNPLSPKDSRAVKTNALGSSASQPLAVDLLAVIPPAGHDQPSQAAMVSARTQKATGKRLQDMDDELAQESDAAPAGEAIVVADASDAMPLVYESSPLASGEELIQVAQAGALLDDPPALAGLTGAQLGIGALVLGGVVIASNNSGGSGGVTSSGDGGGSGSGGSVSYESTYRLTPKTDAGASFDASSLNGPVLFDARLAESSENFVFNVKGSFTKKGTDTAKLTFNDGSYIEIELGSGALKQADVVKAIVDYFNGSSVTVHNADGSVKATYTSGFGAFSQPADGLGDGVYVIYEGGAFADLSSVTFVTTASGGPKTAKVPAGSVVGSDVEGLYLNTLTDGDALVGSKSDTDGLQAQLLSGTTTTPTSISSVEQFFLTAVDADHGKPATLDMSNVTGAVEVWNVESNANLVVNHLQNQVIIGMDGVAGDTHFDVAYADAATFDDDTTQLVIVRNSGVIGDSEADPVINPAPVTLGVEGNDNLTDLDLLAAGDNNLMLRTSGNSDLDGIESLHIASETEGDATGHLMLRAENNFASLKAVDVTGYGGFLDLDASGATGLNTASIGLGDLAMKIAGNDNHTTTFAFLGEDIGAVGITGFDIDDTNEDVLDLSAFFDLNQDGDVDAGEPGYADLTIEDVDTDGMGGVDSVAITFNGTSSDPGYFSGTITLYGVQKTNLDESANFKFVTTA